MTVSFQTAFIATSDPAADGFGFLRSRAAPAGRRVRADEDQATNRHPGLAREASPQRVAGGCAGVVQTSSTSVTAAGGALAANRKRPAARSLAQAESDRPAARRACANSSAQREIATLREQASPARHSWIETARSACSVRRDVGSGTDVPLITGVASREQRGPGRRADRARRASCATTACPQRTLVRAERRTLSDTVASRSLIESRKVGEQRAHETRDRARLHRNASRRGVSPSRAPRSTHWRQ